MVLVDKITKLSFEPQIQRTLGYYWLILCMGMNMGVLGPLLPSLATQTQSHLGDMGKLFLFSSGGAIIGTLFGGQIFDRLRGHVVLGASQIISGLLFLCTPFIPTLGLLLGVVALKGVMDGLINNGVNTLLVWTHREKVSPYMNGLHFCYGLGAFLAPLFVAQVVDISGAYRWVFVGLAGFAILAGICMMLITGSPHALPLMVSSFNTVQPRNIPYNVVLAAALVLFFCVGAEIAFGDWVFSYAVVLKLVLGVQAAYITSLYWLSFTIGRLFSIPLAIRFSPRQIITVALLGCVFFMSLMFVFADSKVVLWVTALGVGFCIAPVYPSSFTLAVQGFKLTAQASSIILLGDTLGCMILPWLVGQMFDMTGPRALLYLVSVSLIFCLLAFVVLLRARSKMIMTFI